MLIENLDGLVSITLVKKPFKRKALLGSIYDEGCFKEKITTVSKAIDYKNSNTIFNNLYDELNNKYPNTYVKQKIQGSWRIIHRINYNVLMYNLSHMY